MVKGKFGSRVKKVRTSVQFKRPRTLRQPRNPKYPRKSTPKRTYLDAYNIIKHPYTTGMVENIFLLSTFALQLAVWPWDSVRQTLRDFANS